MPIQLLAPDVAAKIAAGEVVERPANAVKELIENSLDAGATEIRVEIREGGQRLLRVADNGHGMRGQEAVLAFQRHATSKLQTAEDLSHIATFGFRGEALYSIAAVSHVTLVTRHASEVAGVQLRLEGGVLVGQSKAGSPVGTAVTVEHLFYNMPARKKFLRQPATEAGNITTIIQRFALAHPECRFSLINEGRLAFQTTGSGDLMDVLVKIYGLDNARQMVPIGMDPRTAAARQAGDDLDADVDFMPSVELDTGGFVAPYVSGYASLPSLTRANRSHIDLFVNRRYVEDRNLTHAVVQAYHTLLPVGRYPVAVVLITIDPSQVDVNVHPQKIQVRFVEERRLFSAVQRTVRQAVASHLPVPAMPLESAEGIDGPPDNSGWQVPVGWNMSPPADNSPTPVDWAGDDPARESSTYETPAQAAAAPALPAWSISNHQDARPQPFAQPPLPTQAAMEMPAQETAEAPATSGSRQLPLLRVVGQAGAMYIIAEGPQGLYLIDQHAAHERILYEKFMAQRSQTNGEGQTAIARQQLLDPLTLHAGHSVAGLVAHHLDELRKVGFEVEAFGGDTFLVRAIPAVLADQDPLRTLEEIVVAMSEQRNLVGETTEQKLVKMICKRAAIKAGQLLSMIEMQELVRQLEACQSPRTCPHGRPTMIQLSAGELEKAFGRI